MIDYIKGTLTHIDTQYVVVETTDGIGYQIFTGNPFQFSRFEQDILTIFTYQHVREDILALYGFSSREERSLFEKLLQVSGVGPKAALAILATGTPGQVIAAIQSENITFLTKFPGIGKKTAQRLVIDLKDKLDDIGLHFGKDNALLDDEATSVIEQTPSAQAGGLRTNDAFTEALEALKALGYAEKEVQRIVPQLKEKLSEGWTTEQYIKFGLQCLLK